MARKINSSVITEAGPPSRRAACTEMGTERTVIAWVLGTVLILGGFLSGVEIAQAEAPVRGITLSTHRDGSDWGWDSIQPTLDRIQQIGANWVAIHPYAWIADDGSVRFRGIDPQRPPAALARPIQEAHERGLKILIKPHIGYWGSSFSWRGEIAFETQEQWARFFDSYAEWITQLAAASSEADGFAVGTELDATLSHEREWREIIAAIRGVSDAPLCYAANWADYQRVPFWDELDVIGVQAYFPLSDSVDPSEEQLREGWAKVLTELDAYAAARDRYVLFTELGYNRSYTAAARPWEYGNDGEEAAVLQARCLRVALELIEREPRVIGAFLWKWFPEPHPVGRNFQLAVPHMLEVIRSVWD